MIDSFSIGGHVYQKISFPLLVNWLPYNAPLRRGRKGIRIKSKFRYFHIIRILFCCTHKFYYSINPAKLKKNTKLLQKNKEHFIIHFFDLLLHNLYKIFLHGGSYSTTSSPIEVKRWTLQSSSQHSRSVVLQRDPLYIKHLCALLYSHQYSKYTPASLSCLQHLQHHHHSFPHQLLLFLPQFPYQLHHRLLLSSFHLLRFRN